MRLDKALSLAGYTRWAGGITPRFTPAGTLVLLPPGSGDRVTLDAPALEAVRAGCRYGVISQVVELDGKTGRQRRYDNPASAGIQRRRVMVRSGSGYRATGLDPEARIAAGEEQRRTLEITLPGLFLASPDDIVDLSLPELGAEGTYLVTTAESSGSAQGLFCTLGLRPWEEDC